MLKEATLVSSSGVPIWVRSNGPSIVSGILAGAMLGALSMFSTELTGQKVRSVEMSDGFKLHVRPFGNGEINLAVIGEEEILSDPELLKIIDTLDDHIDLMYSNESNLDLNDHQTTSIYLEKSINELDSWFGSKIFLESVSNKARMELVVGISSRIAVLTSRIHQEKIAVMILGSSLESLYRTPTPNINENLLSSVQAHLKGWIRISSHDALLIPELIFFKEFCLGIKSLKNMYLICAIEWEGSIGSPTITAKIRSWLSTLSRRLGT